MYRGRNLRTNTKKIAIPSAKTSRRKAGKALKVLKSLSDVVDFINAHAALGFTNTGGSISEKIAKEVKEALTERGYTVYLNEDNTDIEIEWWK